MNKETSGDFCLSERIRGNNQWVIYPNIAVEDVKEFVQRLKKIWMLDFYKNNAFLRGDFNKEIDKLAGEELTK